MKNTITGRAAALGLLLLGFLSGCANMLMKPPSRSEEGAPAAGTGQVLVSIGPRAEKARTLMPTEDFGTFAYLLTFSSGSAVIGPVAVTSTGTAVALEAGTWDLSVTGRLNGTDVLEGHATGIIVKAGKSTSVTVTMQGKAGGAGGTLTYSITFPDTVSRGRLGIYGWNNAEVTATVDLLDNATPDSGTITKVGSLSLAGGYYRLGIDLYTAAGVLSRSDIVHIYPGLTTDTGTEYAQFTAGDFVPAAVDNALTSLSAVLNGIAGLSSGDDKVYLLPDGDENLTATDISHAGNVTVTIDGGGRTVTLSGNGSLITVGSGVTLKLKNITLRRRGADTDNDASLMRVTGGNLELNDGIVITGNTFYATTTSAGGGVFVGSGTFTMEDGAITGNTASSPDSPDSPDSSGGGVYVSASGIFTMNDGKITGNTASSSGGGVYVARANEVGAYAGGIFTMNDGKITGNTAAFSGGGVSVGLPNIVGYAGGIFTMNDGEITGNTASSSSPDFSSSYGGGVSVYFGTFNMNGGAISGNTAASFSHSSVSISLGGGVYAGGSSTFTMSDGTISGNTAVSSSPDFSSSSGGGVSVEGGTFTMSGGAITGNTAFSFSSADSSSDSSSYSQSHGGGVSVEGGTFTMSGGAITDNAAAAAAEYLYSRSSGGGVYVFSGTFDMNGGAIASNTVSFSSADPSSSSSGGGVYVVYGTFTKKGGTIYGDTDAIAGNGIVTDNTAIAGSGHAVYLEYNQRRRDTTAGPAITLYASYSSDSESWSYVDSSAEGVGDTTANWEE